MISLAPFFFVKIALAIQGLFCSHTNCEGIALNLGVQLSLDVLESTDEWVRAWKYTYIYTTEYYLTIKRSTVDSVLMRWMNLEPIAQSEVSQKEKDNNYHILMCIYGI